MNAEVVIVGGGAAGLSAALVLGRAQRRVVVIDSGSPRNGPASHMHGFLSRDGFPPSELLSIGRREVHAYGVEIVVGEVKAITSNDASGFDVALCDGQVVRSRRVVVTAGSRDELPDLPGVRERWGRDLLHCPYCHGWEVRDEPLGVLGFAEGSVQHALLVRQWSGDVVFFTHTYELNEDEERRLRARGVHIVRGVVRRLVVSDDRLRGVEVEDGSVVERSAVFVRPINVGRASSLVESLGCAVDGAGFIVVDGAGRTSVPGLYAAGNAADPRAQVITAAGAGSAAAIAINAELVDEDVALAMRALDADG
jgi:thioredoxin reductase